MSGAPPPRPNGAPPPRPNGAPPPRPSAPPPNAAPGGSIPPRPSAPPPATNGVPPPRPNAPPPRPNGSPPPRPSAPPPQISTAPPVSSSNAPPGPLRGAPPGPPRGAPPGPPPGAPPGPPRGAPPGPPRGAPPGPPPGVPPGPPPGAPPGPPPGSLPRPPPGNPSSQPNKDGLPGPPPGAPLGPPPGEPPRPPKDPPPSSLKEGSAPQNTNDNTTAALSSGQIGAIEKLLKRGRFNFKLLEARGLRKKGGTEKKFSADPYVKLKIGSHPLSAKETKSKTLKKCTSTVIFHEEMLFFDLTDPKSLLTDGDVPLKLEVYDENLLSDELLGEVKFSALRYFDGKVHKEVLPLRLPGVPDDAPPSGELEVEIKMDIALVGMISVVLMEGRNLKSMELVGKQDPYCKLSIGAFSKRGKTVQKGGRNPYFEEEELLFWITEDLWVNKMQLSLFDEDIGSDDLIGDAQFSVLHFMEHLGPQEHVIALKNKGQSAGDVLLKIEFFPAGTLTVHCHAGKQLRSVDAIGRQDPYVKFTLEGRATKMIMKTKTDTDGGREPEWENEVFSFQIVDQYNVLVEVWDEDSVGNDDLIGAVTISLLPVFRYGFVDSWFNLWVKGKFGNKDPAGQLRLEMSFDSSPGIAYPQHQVGMDRFTEKERRTKDGALISGSDDQGGDQESDGENKSPSKVNALSAATRTTVAKAKAKQAENVSEFSEEEILGAFRFIDLDKNNFIGAAELRHLLICMGELITDEEIDEMVKLCDKDGDGQVSFDEFRCMVIHPDPSSPEFAMAPVEDPEGPVDVQLITKETTLEEKTRQIEIKEEKRKLMKRFVEDNNPNLDLLMRIALKFRQMHKDELDFEDFCMLFEVEPTGEYRRLFALYTEDGQSEEGADLREILLGVVNFMEGADRTQRVKFCFEIFDDDHNGFITEEELVNILKANHMTTEAQVKKKAQTIMKQADDNGDNKMSLNEFYVIAKKFPNLLFPSHDSVQGSVI